MREGEALGNKVQIATQLGIISQPFNWTVMKRASTALFAALCTAGISEAQTPPVSNTRITVSGVVRNSDGAELAGAEVIAGDLHAITNEAGEFTLSDVPGGNVLLYVRRIGYVPGTLEFRSDPSLKSISVLARLVPAAVSLGTIVVEGKRLDIDLYRNGFYRRRNLGRGVYMDEGRIARAPSLGTAANEVAGVRVERGTGGISIPTARAGTSIMGPSYCVMSVMLDEVYLPWVEDIGLDAIIPQSEVAAMEVYRSANMIPGMVLGKFPPQKSECGLIMLWSKKRPAEGGNK